MLRTVLVLAAALPSLACSATLRRPIQTTEAATQLEQVTRSTTNERDPAVSPDASSVAYEVASSPDAPSHVEVASLADARSAPPSRVEDSSAGAADIGPAWMPDGSGLVFTSTGAGTSRLSLAIRIGLRGTAFLPGAEVSRLFGEWPAVSPDGHAVAMSVSRTRLFETGWRSTERIDQALAVSDLDGANLVVLGIGSEPAWSPDGKSLAFTRTVAGHRHLFVARADGTEDRPITDGPDDDERPTWSPDGRSIAFCTTLVDATAWPQSNLFVVRADGSGLVQLTEGDHVACHPSWGRDGFVYFHANARDRFHIWRLRPRLE